MVGAVGVTINSGVQNGQICAVVRAGQGSETSSSAELRTLHLMYLCADLYC
jgi:hypothetical protein